MIVQKPVAELSEAALARFVGRVRRAVRLGGGINVLVASSRKVQGLNRRFRGKNQPTDVLSFPAINGGDSNGFAGEIAISSDIATRNARRLGHAPVEEIKILILHGVLHLAGYDHEQDNGRMEREERRLRRSLALPAGLIERNRGTAKPARRVSRAKTRSR